MGVLDVPKAVYKAQQAKKRMSKIEVVGSGEGVSVLINGINEVKEIEIDTNFIREIVGDIESDKLEKLAKKIAEETKNAMSDGKKKLEKELMSSANLDELKGLLGG